MSDGDRKDTRLSRLTTVEVLRAFPELALGLVEVFLAALVFLGAALVAGLVAVFFGAAFLVVAVLVAVFCLDGEQDDKHRSSDSDIPW